MPARFRDWRWHSDRADYSAAVAMLHDFSQNQRRGFYLMSSLPVLVLNSGSSSIKFAMYEAGDGQRTKLYRRRGRRYRHRSRQVLDQGRGAARSSSTRRRLCPIAPLPSSWLPTRSTPAVSPAPKAIGHRTVCGGPTVRENQLITPELIDEIESYTAFAPLHTPIAVYIMREALRLFPGVPNFAMLDTYFHRTMPEVVTHMPIPAEYSAMGVRRYGYHGISYESIVYQLQPNVPGEIDRRASRQRRFHHRDPQWQMPRYFDGPHSDRRHHQRNAHRRHRSRRRAVHPQQDCRDNRKRRRSCRQTRNRQSARRPACWA